MAGGSDDKLVLVARKAAFDLPTACPSCLPVYIYLRLANTVFDLHYDRFYPDGDHIPYAELGDYVAFNNENGGVIEGLKADGIVDLDSNISNLSKPDWLSAKAMISSWLSDAVDYELWVSSDGSVADIIYFSDLPWPIKKSLHWKQSWKVKNILGITQYEAPDKEKEIYRRATLAYEALSLRLGEQTFLFDDRPTSLDAILLGHLLFVLHAYPDSSTLRGLLVNHHNLVRYSENLSKFLEASPSPSGSVPKFLSDTSSSMPKGESSSRWRSRSKPKPKKEKTEEEKTFRRRAKYFLAAQLVAVVVFLSVMGGHGSEDLEIDIDDD